jgi:hypothetical protein
MDNFRKAVSSNLDPRSKNVAFVPLEATCLGQNGLATSSGFCVQEGLLVGLASCSLSSSASPSVSVFWGVLFFQFSLSSLSLMRCCAVFFLYWLNR